MPRSLIDGTDIGDAMRDIQRREGRDGMPMPLDDVHSEYEIKMVPLAQAERRVIGLVKFVLDGRAYVRPGSICTHCNGDRRCSCYNGASPTHWGRLPDTWNIR